VTNKLEDWYAVVYPALWAKVHGRFNDIAAKTYQQVAPAWRLYGKGRALVEVELHLIMPLNSRPQFYRCVITRDPFGVDARQPQGMYVCDDPADFVRVLDDALKCFEEEEKLWRQYCW